MRKLRNKKGFTLVELIVVLIILVILAAILIPSLTGYINKAKDKEYIIAARNIETATKSMYMETYAETGAKIAGIKLNYTSNLQKTAHGAHFVQLAEIWKYQDGKINGCNTIDEGDSAKPIAKKCFASMMNLVETGDIYLSTATIFFDKNGKIVSNNDHKIAGQGVSTTLVFRDKNKNVLKKVKYDDDKGWYVE